MQPGGCGGEVSNRARQQASRHFYFSLKARARAECRLFPGRCQPGGSR